MIDIIMVLPLFSLGMLLINMAIKWEEKALNLETPMGVGFMMVVAFIPTLIIGGGLIVFAVATIIISLVLSIGGLF